MEFGISPGPQYVELRSEVVIPGRLTMEFASEEPRPPRLVHFQIESEGTPTVEIRRGRGRGGPYELNIDGRVVGGEEDGSFRFSGILPVIRRVGPPLVGRPSPNRERARWRAWILIGEFRRTLSSFRAVGAFRAAPERRYDYQGRPTEAAELSGQNAVYALIEDSMRRGKHRGTLINSLNRWLKIVGRVRLMPLRRISPNARLYELRLKDVESGRWANFADVGFGIGQAFPVLVEGLRTPPDSMFIVQEPEIHLHPDAQLAMADYLVDLARSGRTVIVETHSEAILLRVRKAVAEADRGLGGHQGLREDQLSIVHVESDKDGNSHTTPLRVDELGQVQGWPEGFMEEVTRERLDILGAMARKSEG